MASRPFIVLASQSPRRSVLLTEAGFDFEAIPSFAQEKTARHHDIHEIVIENARIKGMDVAQRIWAEGRVFSRPTVLVAADTLVVRKETVYGKPRDLVEAEQFMVELGGVEHQVLTGVFLYRLDSRRRSEFCETTRVTLKKMSHEQIMELFTRVTPLDKAAGYGFQDAPEIVVCLIGSKTNVIGLPMERLEQALRVLCSPA